MMNRYLLFAGPSFNSLGGWNEFRSSHSTEIEAIDAAQYFIENDYRGDWYQIVDTETMKQIRGKG